jgi:adenine/guanine phosphoribosyltransferase-like PRPP-binding protein
VLVIDDVVTTGSTLRSAERALRTAGARSIVRAAVATTPALVQREAATTRTRQRTTPRSTVVQGPWAA